MVKSLFLFTVFFLPGISFCWSQDTDTLPSLPDRGQLDNSPYTLLVSSSFSTVQSTESPAGFSSSSLPVVTIVYPYENLKIPAVQKMFIFGNVKPSTASLRINGEAVKTYSNGSFLAYLPVKEGTFKFEAEAFDGVHVSSSVRTIQVAEGKQVKVSTSGFYLEAVSPLGVMELMSGDYVNFAARATPNQEIIYDISGVARGEMEEYPAGSGNYYGAYRVKESDRSEGSDLSMRFKKGFFSRSTKWISPNSIRIRRNAFVLRTSTDSVILKNDPYGGYAVFLSSGVKLFATGKINSMYRVKLGGQTLWVSDSSVDFISDNIRKPRTETGNMIFTTLAGNAVEARLAIYEKVPYSVYERDESLELVLYYTSLHTNWVVYDSSDVFIKNVEFRQEGEDEVRYVFNFHKGKKLWGYDISYSTSNALVIGLKFRPDLTGGFSNPLKGLKIVLDPGHSPKREPPFDGAIGPSGSFEYEVNMNIALRLREKLSALGAEVFMTRHGEDNMPLVARPLFARRVDGDLFISLHNNAIADGDDPFSKPRGFQVYYYHAHSMDLGREIHRAFIKNIPLPDEGLRYGDYHVIRQTWMPAVLIEHAYMIIPEQEEILNDARWQDRFAETVKEGILNFVAGRK